MTHGPGSSLGQDRVGLGGIPTLDDLATDPSKVAGLPPEVARQLTLRCAAALTALASVQPAVAYAEPQPEDRLLTPGEAATLLQMTPRWLYRHHKQLPFTRRLSRKALRFSEMGLKRWVAARRS